jgi:hypothetical protein
MSKTYKAIHLFVGVLGIFFYIYIRIFRVRLPIDLIYFCNYILMFFAIWVICLHTYMLIKIFKISEPPKYFSLILNFFFNSFFTVFELIYKRTRLKNIFIVLGELFLSLAFNNYNLSLRLFIIFDFFPRVILLIAFLTDIFIFQKFEIFYNCLIFLIFPIFLRLIMFGLNYYYTALLEIININLILMENSFFIVEPDTGYFCTSSEYFEHLDFCLHLKFNIYMPYKSINDIWAIKISNSLIHGLYIFGWSNILIKILIHTF